MELYSNCYYALADARERFFRPNTSFYHAIWIEYVKSYKSAILVGLVVWGIFCNALFSHNWKQKFKTGKENLF